MLGVGVEGVVLHALTMVQPSSLIGCFGLQGAAGPRCLFAVVGRPEIFEVVVVVVTGCEAV